MNFYDSQKITTILESKGYQLQDSADNADLVVFNTCNIRDKAAHKVYSDIAVSYTHLTLPTICSV